MVAQGGTVWWPEQNLHYRGDDDMLASRVAMCSNKGLIVKKLPLGSIIIDSKSWQYKDDINYSGDIRETSPVEWVVIKHGHFDSNATLLISKKIVALYNFNADNTNVWDTSDLRVWLRDVFYNHLSQDFKNNIKDVTTYTAGSSLLENIFILSQVEIGGGTSSISGNHGNDIGYFIDNSSRIAQGYTSVGLRDWNYWSRSNSSENNTVRYIDTIGDLFYRGAAYNNWGVRPVLNLKNNIKVKFIDGKYILI